MSFPDGNFERLGRRYSKIKERTSAGKRFEELKRLTGALSTSISIAMRSTCYLKWGKQSLVVAEGRKPDGGRLEAFDQY